MKISRRNFFRLSGLALLTGPLAAKLGCTVTDNVEGILEKPGLDKQERETEYDLEKNDAPAENYNLYKSMMAVQLSYLNQIKVSVPFSENEIESYYREGQFLLSQKPLEFDPKAFKKVLSSITRVIEENKPGTSQSLKKLSEVQEFAPENVQKFLHVFTVYDKPQLEEYIECIGMDERTDLDSELIFLATSYSAGLFYNKYREEVEEISDFSLWRLGYCPVCGQTVTIAKHREEDGARIMECWLCHADWYHPRLECPYCENKDYKKLRFFYVDGDRSRQVHVCEVCRSYLKVIDHRILEKETNLILEDIATEYLDVLAEQEGYKFPLRNKRPSLAS